MRMHRRTILLMFLKRGTVGAPMWPPMSRGWPSLARGSPKSQRNSCRTRRTPTAETNPARTCSSTALMAARSGSTQAPRAKEMLNRLSSAGAPEHGTHPLHFISLRLTSNISLPLRFTSLHFIEIQNRWPGSETFRPGSETFRPDMCVPISKISGLGLKLSDPGLKLSDPACASPDPKSMTWV